MMSSVLGDYDLVTYIHVRKGDGTGRYYRVQDESNVEIDRDEFLANGGVEG